MHELLRLPEKELFDSKPKDRKRFFENSFDR